MVGAMQYAMLSFLFLIKYGGLTDHVINQNTDIEFWLFYSHLSAAEETF